MSSPISVFTLPFQGLGLMLSPGIKRFVIMPLLINILIYVGIAWIGITYFDAFIESFLPEDSWLSFLEWLLWPLFAISYLIVMFYSFTILANILAAPFNGLLAEKIEEKLTGKAPPEVSGSLLKDAIPAMLGELGKLWYFISRAIPILICMLIPGVNIIASFVWILFGFWFLTFEYAEFTLSNHALKAKEQRKLLRSQPLSVLSFGASVSLLMLIPVVGFAVMPASVAGGTLFWIRNLKS